tara:strand:- start:590 stop:1618 length:1029 start_codon:yes stop_codon:yes gene_type:complete
MNKIIFSIFIIVFLFKTETLLSNNNIFFVDNILLNNKDYENNEDLLNSAFKKGFKKLINKILKKEDAKELSNTSLKEIKSLISNFQLIDGENLENKNETLVRLSFHHEKVNRFFYIKNISYADVYDTKVILFPVLIKENNFFLYSKNFFYENWNKKKEDNDFIDYILPVENIDDVQFINLNKDSLETAKVEKILLNYNVNDFVFLIIKPNKKKINIFLKSSIAGNKIIKNFSLNSELNNFEIIRLAKSEIEEIWKSQNLIDVRTPSFLNVTLDIDETNDLYKLQNNLSKIDVIDQFNVIELNNEFAKIKIKYFGKIDKIKSKFIEQGIKVIIVNNQWKLKLI